MAGAAIIVSLQQLKSLLGITDFTNQMGLIPVMTSVFHSIHEVGSPLTFAHKHARTQNFNSNNCSCL